MNFYCLDCGSVWMNLGARSERCNDCGSTDIATETDLTEKFVREHVLRGLPDASDQPALLQHLMTALGPNLNLQEMILNGPFQWRQSREANG